MSQQNLGPEPRGFTDRLVCVGAILDIPAVRSAVEPQFERRYGSGLDQRNVLSDAAPRIDSSFLQFLDECSSFRRFVIEVVAMIHVCRATVGDDSGTDVPGERPAADSLSVRVDQAVQVVDLGGLPVRHRTADQQQPTHHRV